MYQVYIDGYLMYSTTLSDYVLINPKLELEDNRTGSFTFTIYPDHPYYNVIQKLRSLVEVYQDSFLVFRGRVLNDEVGFYNQKTIICEGEMAFLLDSVIRPYEYTGDVRGFLSKIITEHNAQVEESKQFVVGNVTVTDPNNYITRSDINYTPAWDVLQAKLIDLLGGHLIIRHESDGNYIDYLDDYNSISNQTIEFAKNLIDINRIRKGEDIITALIPLGAKLLDAEGNETDERLTIESVNSGVDYIYNQAAVNSYGWIFGTQIWDDVTVASNLKTKGQAYLDDMISMSNTVELSAADLAGIQEVSSFHLGQYVKVISSPHGMDEELMVTKISIDLLNPANNKLTLGGIINGFTDKANAIEKVTQNITGRIDDVSSRSIGALNRVRTELTSTIEQTAESILQEVSATYITSDGVNDIAERVSSAKVEESADAIRSEVSEIYSTKDEVDGRITEISTTIEQTAEGIYLQFQGVEGDINGLRDSQESGFGEIKRYIRFVDGNILLGEEGNSLELKIENDRISFRQNDEEVAYFSDNKLFVTDGEFVTSLKLGNFAFVPRDSGNLSFMKVT